MALQVSASLGEVPAYVAREKRSGRNAVVLTERVYEYEYLRSILIGVFEKANGMRFKTDDVALNLCLLSLLLDFGGAAPDPDTKRGYP